MDFSFSLFFPNLFHYFYQFDLFCLEFIYIREQGAKIHDCVSRTLPEHGFPPWDGAGCVQDRVRDILPAPHVTLQEPQLPQFDQPPCTAIKMLILVHKIKKKRRVLYSGCNIIKTTNYKTSTWAWSQVTFLWLVIGASTIVPAIGRLGAVTGPISDMNPCTTRGRAGTPRAPSWPCAINYLQRLELQIVVLM